MNLVSYIPGETIYYKFTSRKVDATPITLSGSPVISVYKTSSTTESTSGVTLTVDFDSRTGLNHLVINTSSDSTFYSSNGEFDAILTAGTVDGISVVGEVVYHFTIQDALYHADIAFTRDQTNTQDEYTITWFKNGVRVSSGITSPTIQVVKRVDGTDLIASTSMTQIGTTGCYKYTEATNRITVGEAVIVIVSAIIDTGTRSFSRVISRDS